MVYNTLKQAAILLVASIGLPPIMVYNTLKQVAIILISTIGLYYSGINLIIMPNISYII
jgi:hypothetical protein